MTAKIPISKICLTDPHKAVGVGQQGRAGDRGSVVEAMTSGRAETVWSRGCAAWMASIDVADVMRDDFWLGQVESHGETQRLALSLWLLRWRWLWLCRCIHLADTCRSKEAVQLRFDLTVNSHSQTAPVLAGRGPGGVDSSISGLRGLEPHGGEGPEGLAGAEPASAEARAAARAYMSR